MKNIKQHFVLLAICLVFSTSIQAQSNYIKGSIVHFNGDTVNGYINNQGW